MRFTLTFALLGLLIMGCGRRDALLHKQLTGDLIGERAIVTLLRGVEQRRHAVIPLEVPPRNDP